jgi:AraC-like DNA-binding protein
MAVDVTTGSAAVPARLPSEDARDRVQQALGLEFGLRGDRRDARWDIGSIASFGPVRTKVATAGPVRVAVERTAAFARRNKSDTYKLELLLAGRLVVAQDGREAALRPGDFAVCDMTRPLLLGYPGGSVTRVMALLVPRVLVSLSPAEMAEVTAVRMSGRHGTAGLLSALLVRLADSVDEFAEADAVRVAGTVTDLLATALAGRLDRRCEPTAEQARRSLLRQVYTFVEERLSDSRLTPASVAAAHHVSVRYLYRLFEDEGHTVAGWIRSRRLERCRRDLAEPALLGRPVSAIAARWGFPDPTHFSRVFRAAHAVTPREYRVMHNPDEAVAA